IHHLLRNRRLRRPCPRLFLAQGGRQSTHFTAKRRFCTCAGGRGCDILICISEYARQGVPRRGRPVYVCRAQFACGGVLSWCSRGLTTHFFFKNKNSTLPSALRNGAASCILNSAAGCLTTTTPRACCRAMTPTAKSTCCARCASRPRSSSPCRPMTLKKQRCGQTLASAMTWRCCA